MQEKEKYRKFRCCLCLWLRPCNEILIGGALTLKMVTQICYLLDFFISLSYVMIFVIVHSYVWVYMSVLYMLQTLCSIILLCDTATFDLGLVWVYRARIILTNLGLLSLLTFYLLQTNLIDIKMRGTYFSIHYLVLKVIYDAFQSYFIWSRHLHESGQTMAFVLVQKDDPLEQGTTN